MSTQRMVALDRANRVRLARASVKRQVHAGELSVLDALADPSLENMRLYELLMAQRQWGRWRTRRLLLHTGIGEWKTCGQLTDRQVRLLADELEPGRVAA